LDCEQSPKPSIDRANQHRTSLRREQASDAEWTVPSGSENPALEAQSDPIFPAELAYARHIRIGKQDQLAIFPCRIDIATVKA